MPTLGVLALLFLLGFGFSQAFLSAFPQAESVAANLTEFQFETTKPATLPAIAAYVVMDEATGEVLLSQNEATLLPTASVVKLLVAGVALVSVDLSASTTITAGDVATEEDFGQLSVGEVYTLRELLVPYLLESSNDAGAAIRRTWGGELATGLADLFRDTNTTDTVSLAEYNGLSSETKATARALATITRVLADEHPELFDITRLPRYVGPTATLVNNSPVHTVAGYQGGKHGYTEAAGRTLVARIATPFPDGERTLIYVILGGTNQATDLATLKGLVDEHVTRIPRPATTSVILSAPTNE
jgi:D-alanyl-D-alanine carboxypeptidase (penicillin-binding protein 5/6)